MTPPFFAGDFGLTLDPKNRIVLPAAIRKELNTEVYGSTFFVQPKRMGTTRYRSLWLYPENYFRFLAQQDAQSSVPDPVVDDYYRLKYGRAGRATCDTQGRVQLPSDKVGDVGLSKDLTLVGIRDHLELWSASDWKEYGVILDANEPDIVRRVREIVKENQLSGAVNLEPHR